MPDRADAGQDVVSGGCAVESWQACWTTRTGPSHLRRGVVREDAVTARGHDGVLAVAVSDGHGMARAFRAHIGSQLAADLAVAEALSASERWCEPVSDVDAAHWVATEFTTVVLQRWREQVRQHRDAHPFTAAELSAAGYDSGESDPKLADDDALVAYGTTLLVAMAAGRRVLAWQLGDGDLVAAIGGQSAGPVVPVDPTLFGNRTTSLCLPDAHQQARSGALYLGAEPVLLVIASDGFGNAMVADDWQEQLGRDLHERLLTSPFEDTARRIPSWAQEAAVASGDDVTVALLAGGYGRPVARRNPTVAPMPVERSSVGGEPEPAMPDNANAHPVASVARAVATPTLVLAPHDQFEPVAVKRRSWWPRGALLALAATLVIAAGLVALYLARDQHDQQPTKPSTSQSTKGSAVPSHGSATSSPTDTQPPGDNPAPSTSAGKP